MAAIGALEDAPAVLEGKTGNIITPAGDYGGRHDLGHRHLPRRDSLPTA
jgi:carbamate kinase